MAQGTWKWTVHFGQVQIPPACQRAPTLEFLSLILPGNTCQGIVNGMKASTSDLGPPIQWRGFFLRPLAQHANPYVVLND